MALINKLTAIADAIREKTSKTELLTIDQMVEEIAGLETGGGGITLGTFTFSTFPGSHTHQIAHGLNSKPKGIAIYRLSTTGNAASLVAVFAIFEGNGSSRSDGLVLYHDTTISGAMVYYEKLMNTDLSDAWGIICDAEHISIDLTAKDVYLRNGSTYYWVAFSEEALG